MRKKTIAYWVFLEGFLLGLCGLCVYFVPLQILNQPFIFSFFIYAIITQILIALNVLRHPEAARDDLYQFEEKQSGS